MPSLIVATALGSMALACAWMALQYGETAQYSAADRSASISQLAMWWAAAAAAFGFVGAVVGIWPG
jgi:hypothetical protein